MLFPPRSGWREGLRGVELAVACWLDSVVVGEDHIHGQVRSAIKLAGRHSGRGSLVFLDLAMPRNVEPAGSACRGSS